MTRFQIVEGRPWHCGQMTRLLRHEHQRALVFLGINSHHELRACFDGSCYRRAWFIDGDLAALGGVLGNTISTTGFLWLAISERARKYPVEIVKESRRQIETILTMKHEVATTILGEDKAAMRLAVFLGFHVAHGAIGAPAYSRASRRVLIQYLDSDPARRMPIKGSYVIPMGLHREEAA
jgi:hypothetical protein